MNELIIKYEHKYDKIIEQIKVCTLKDELKEAQLSAQAELLKEIINDLKQFK